MSSPRKEYPYLWRALLQAVSKQSHPLLGVSCTHRVRNFGILPKKEMKRSKTLLVVECQSRLNWYKVFEGATLADGTEIKVEQAEWDDIIPISYYDSGR